MRNGPDDNREQDGYETALNEGLLFPVPRAFVSELGLGWPAAVTRSLHDVLNEIGITAAEYQRLIFELLRDYLGATVGRSPELPPIKDQVTFDAKVGDRMLEITAFIGQYGIILDLALDED